MVVFLYVSSGSGRDRLASPERWEPSSPDTFRCLPERPVMTGSAGVRVLSYLCGKPGKYLPGAASHVRRTCGPGLAGSISGRYVTLDHELKLDLTLRIHFAPVSKSAVPRS